MSLNKLTQELKALTNPVKAKVLAGFFKTGVGQYGEGDKFLGLTVPNQRLLVKKYYSSLTFNDIEKLLTNPYHECRLTGCLMLVAKYQQAKKDNDVILQKKIFAFYLKHTSAINNWDLVDLTAEKIVGDYLLGKPKGERKILYNLAKSDNLWARRISIIATFAFIKNKQFSNTINLAKILLADSHDLMHKAVGWMLREVGKRDQQILKDFLHQYRHKMSRTTLRYAIEKFTLAQRQHYLKNSRDRKLIDI